MQEGTDGVSHGICRPCMKRFQEDQIPPQIQRPGFARRLQSFLRNFSGNGKS